MNSAAGGISSRGTSSPHSRNCGKISAGMNCTAWNSVRASELDASPIVTPRIAESTETPTSIHSGPATFRSRTTIA